MQKVTLEDSICVWFTVRPNPHVRSQDGGRVRGMGEMSGGVDGALGLQTLRHGDSWAE